jgi:hypothetical protein
MEQMMRILIDESKLNFNPAQGIDMVLTTASNDPKKIALLKQMTQEFAVIPYITSINDVQTASQVTPAQKGINDLRSALDPAVAPIEVAATTRNEALSGLLAQEISSMKEQGAVVDVDPRVHGKFSQQFANSVVATNGLSKPTPTGGRAM